MNWVMFFSIATGVMGIFTVIAQSMKDRKDDKERLLDKEQIIKLQKESNDTLIKINHLQGELNSSQTKVLELQEKNQEVQSELFNQVLGGNTIDKSYTAFSLIDQATFLPVRVAIKNVSRFEKPLFKIFQITQQLLGNSNNEFSVKEGGEPPRIKVASFLQKVNQYKIVSDLISIQNSQFSIDPNRNTYGYIPPTDYIIDNPIKLESYDKIDVDKIFLASFGNDYFKGNPGNGILKVPKNTKLIIQNPGNAESTGQVVYNVKLLNEGYFTIEFAIKDNSFGRFQLNHQITPKLKDIIESTIGSSENMYLYCQLVILKANFNSKALNVSKLAEYKKWAEWIFKRLHEMNAMPI
ncbi:MAG: hypothetical protein ABIN36_02380 [Ferruginibacter sp.]